MLYKTVKEVPRRVALRQKTRISAWHKSVKRMNEWTPAEWMNEWAVGLSHDDEDARDNRERKTAVVEVRGECRRESKTKEMKKVLREDEQ